jgi:argininosuccinate lyase
LPHLLRIDAAHIIMLAKTGILARPGAAALLAINRDLAQRLAAGEPVLEPPSNHRGLYLVYEQEYIRRLGAQEGGAAHVARSRNDINATVVRMRLREGVLSMLDECAGLLQAALALGRRHTESLMSGFTHLQPSQPASLGHYLAGIAAELTRGAESLAASLASVDRCPMGAAAGAGTSFPVDRELVAGLLAFSEPVDNSLDAVASRDYVAGVLAVLASLGVTLSRWATDFQAWGSHAYGFLDWPDDLVSTSSIMPQKRNAYVWETVRGQAVRPSGALVSSLMGMKNTSFSNSVEVSSEATSHLWPALEALGLAVRLTRLLIENTAVRPERMRSFLRGAQITMTALADHLVSRHGLAFRTAHEAVAALVSGLPAGEDAKADSAKAELENIVYRLTGRRIELDEGMKAAFDPQACLAAASYGGGPAPDAVAEQLRRLGERLRRLEAHTGGWRERLDRADRELEEAVHRFNSMRD